MTTDEEVSNFETNLGLSDSRVFFGNLVLVPIEESLLYVRPFYVEPSGGNRVPELRKVVAYFDQQVVIEDTLEEALVELFGDAPDTGEDVPGGSGEGGGETPPPADDETVAELLEKAQTAFNEADDAFAKKDFVTWARKEEEGRGYVEEAQQRAGSSTTTTALRPGGMMCG